ncbi:alkaline phosphatase PhoY [soil metagenome]
MIRFARGWSAACLGLLLAPAVALAAPPPSKPKLVVAISVDQFALSLFQTYRPTYVGGLKRLADGLSFTGYQSHAATETCPGHSTILTGDHPARTGIVANNWYDRKTGSNIYCVSKVGIADPLAKTGALLKVDTLGDWLRATSPGSRSIAVSGKDRAAIMMGGHHATAIYWWEDGLGFGTSQYAGPATTATLAPAKAFNKTLFASWKKSPPSLWPATVSARCTALEKPFTFGKLELSGKIPPDSAKGLEKGKAWMADTAFQNELRASPIFDPLALKFAETIVTARQLGKGPATDLLAVSLSSTDHIGHRFGSGGAEMCVQMAALDAALGEFFTRLDALKTPYVVMLTADHGGVDAAERLGKPATRVDVAAISAGLAAHLRKTFDLAYDPLGGDDSRQVILNLAPDDEKRRPQMTKAVVAWLIKKPGVDQAFIADEIAAAGPKPDTPVEKLSVAERFHESFDRDRSGDVIVSYAEGASLGVPQGPGANIAGHGAPWDTDRRVPILFWWPGVTPVADTHSMETVDIAPTLAAVIGVKPPSVDGKCVDIGQGCPAK